MAAIDDFKILDDAIKAGRQAVVLPDGRNFNLEGARAERDRLGKQLEKEKQTTTYQESIKNKEIKNAEKLVANAQTSLDATLRAFNRGRSSATEVKDSQDELAARQTTLNQLTNPTVAQTMPSAAVTADTKVLSRGQRGELAQPTDEREKLDVVPPKPTKPTKPTTQTKSTTPTTPTVPEVSSAWETTFRETFPAKAWLLDLDRTKYPQLFQLLNTAIAQKLYASQEGLTRFTASLENTDFYKELSTSKQLKTIQSLVGTLGFEGSDFTKFVSDSINMGFEGDILKQKVYSEVFKKDDTGKYVNPTALKRTQASADYISTQNIAKAFFNTNPSNSDIENVLTGKILSSDYERQQREFAKTRYGHLSNLLDQGMTLESIASAYKTTASRLLERNVNDIDMSTGAFEQAVTFGAEGKKRLMTNSEWEKLLRTDPQYGWERTNNAKDEARSLSANIAQAFGRIL